MAIKRSEYNKIYDEIWTIVEIYFHEIFRILFIYHFIFSGMLSHSSLQRFSLISFDGLASDADGRPFPLFMDHETIILSLWGHTRFDYGRGLWWRYVM